ncbi:capsule biosynthesis GfcC family protein [Lysobacter sp. CA196]|uniref:capsule biosynthesis GfcC family protein n=1 Tax=Lysobacter sp. CA196 TaxID=3455606 RepID=UPI003F8D1915
MGNRSTNAALVGGRFLRTPRLACASACTLATRSAAATLLLIALCGAPASAQLRVAVSGAVERPGEQTYAGKARLRDAALAARVRPQAYVAGAAWLRPSLVEAQRRFQVGVLFDLSQVIADASARNDEALLALSERMAATVRALPATGRRIVSLDPKTLERDRANNAPLAEGDRLHYPELPKEVRIVGAVNKDCVLPHASWRGVRDYLDDCPAMAAADRDRVQLIQADGRVVEYGIALWNRGEPLRLAPGTTIYLPIDDRLVRRIAPDLNREYAQFLATQPLPEAGSAASPPEAAAAIRTARPL